jgi:hypothetical protein
MLDNFHTMLLLFFKHCYKQKKISASWKTSLTILLYKKGDPSLLTNHKPIALANTIYKLFTSTLTLILSAYGEKYQILHDKCSYLSDYELRDTIIIDHKTIYWKRPNGKELQSLQ